MNKMSVSLSLCFLLNSLIIVGGIVIFLCYVRFKLVSSRYWSNRNVFQLEPTFILGNSWKAVFSDNVGALYEKRHRKWKHKRLLGFWSFTSPTLLVMDPGLVKRILVSDFQYFTDRTGNSANENLEPLAGHLFNLKGSKWKSLRTKLTPTFTSGKIKTMFSNVLHCGNRLGDHLSRNLDSGCPPRFKEVFGCFTTDVISSCAFGLDTNTIDHPNGQFRHLSRRIFPGDFLSALKTIVALFFPTVRDFFRVRTISKDVSDFFINVVKEAVDSRKGNNMRGNHFIDLLSDLNDSSFGPSEDPKKLTLNQIAAQAFMFFVAGYETSSATLLFAMYELAMNPHIQTKLYQEIQGIMTSGDNEFTYEMIAQMDYLDKVIKETLRKYPPLSFIARKCTRDYQIPEIDVALERGTRIIVSLLGLHRDADTFPDPDSFDPDRFSPEEANKRHHFSYLPFGEGPRSCIGARFGLLQVKVGVVSVLSRFAVHPTEDTPVSLKYSRKGLILTTAGEIPLKLVRRQ